MWLAIYVPDLPLQAFSRELQASVPTVIFDHRGRRTIVVSRNRIAAQSGIKNAQSLAEANALTHQLVAILRDPDRETACLHRLADALSSLTPGIHVSNNFGLLLDVAGSVKLHGSCKAMMQQAIDICEKVSIRTRLVLAPTARGARWLTHAYRELIVETRIDDWLDDLPVACMDISYDLIAELRGLNLHHLSAVRRQDSAELNRRLGTELTVALDQAYGAATQSLSFRKVERTFHQYVEFLDLTREQSHWWHGAVVLVRQLQEFLRLQGQTACELQFTFSNGHQQFTELMLASAQGTHHADEWLKSLQAGLERISLNHEISRIDLQCRKLKKVDIYEPDFFDQSKTRQLIWASLLDLLSSRISLPQLRRRPRHPGNALPESCSAPLHQMQSGHTESLRPSWLIDPPQRLRGDVLLRLRHSLSRHQPERIEAHWGTQHYANEPAALRDYYIAVADHHCYWWVFRERMTDQWFLQGIFS